MKLKLKILKNEDINKQMKKLLKKSKCSKCCGELRQGRSGSKVAYCVNCNARFKAYNKNK